MLRLAVAVLVLAGLPACGGTIGPVAGPASASPDLPLPRNACALVSLEEVESAAGRRVERWGTVPDRRLHSPDPSGSTPCEYIVHGRHESILIWVHPDGARDFARERDRDPVNTKPLPGVGDEAFTHALASLSVRVGDGYFVLVTQHGAGRAGIEDLRRLALDAVDRLRT